MDNAKRILNSLKMNCDILGDLVREMPYSPRRLVIITVGRIIRMWMVLGVINSLKGLFVEWNYGRRRRREMIVKYIIELGGSLFLVMTLSTQ